MTFPTSPKPTFFGRFRSRDISTKSPIRTSTPEPLTAQSQNCSQSEKRKKQIQDMLDQPIIDLERIRSMAWAGIPDEFRARVWRLFLDYEPVNVALRDQTLEHKRRDYFDCLDRIYSGPQKNLWTNAQKQTILQIRKDLPRTHLTLLRTERVQALFERILFVYSVRHPASGYVQGMNDLLQPFFFAFILPFMGSYCVKDIGMFENIDNIDDTLLNNIEADCFWCFSKLLDGLQDIYTKDQQ